MGIGDERNGFLESGDERGEEKVKRESEERK